MKIVIELNTDDYIEISGWVAVWSYRRNAGK